MVWLLVDAKLYLCRNDVKVSVDGIMPATHKKAPDVCFVSTVHHTSPLGLCSSVIAAAAAAACTLKGQ